MAFSGRFSEALVFAAQLHRDQKRKSDRQVPYVGHLLSVCSIVIEYGGNEEEAIAALLHDAIEDQGGESTRDTLRRLFGDRVVEIVDGCTEIVSMPRAPWQERKQHYIAGLRHASPSVLLVAAADKLSNARSLAADLRQNGDSVWHHFNGTQDQTLWFYRAVLEVLRERGPRALVAELERAVEALEEITSGVLER